MPSFESRAFGDYPEAELVVGDTVRTKAETPFPALTRNEKLENRLELGDDIGDNDDDMAEIVIRGHVCLVDEDQKDMMSQFRWRVFHDRKNGRIYAYRYVWPEGWKGKVARSYMHREVMGLPIVAFDPREVDHRSLNTLDNRRQNLRVCDRSENNCNRGMRKDNTSGIKGVSADPAKPGFWKAQIMKDKKAYCLGSFPDKEQAAAVYAEAAKRLHGEFARIARSA